MSKKNYISEDERQKCQKVIEAFAELFELENSVVLDAGKYGFVFLLYYVEGQGFSEDKCFTDSQELFEALWQEWFETQLFLIGKDTEEIDNGGYDEVFQSLSKEEQVALTSRKADFVKAAGIEL